MPFLTISALDIYPKLQMMPKHGNKISVKTFDLKHSKKNNRKSEYIVILR